MYTCLIGTLFRLSVRDLEINVYMAKLSLYRGVCPGLIPHCWSNWCRRFEQTQVCVACPRNSKYAMLKPSVTGIRHYLMRDNELWECTPPEMEGPWFSESFELCASILTLDVCRGCLLMSHWNCVESNRGSNPSSLMALSVWGPAYDKWSWDLKSPLEIGGMKK